MHACVIGAGIVGVTTAHRLATEGWQVTLVDAAGAPASGTSHANGGQLSYNFVEPMAKPGVLSKLPGWLFDRNSPLRFRLRLDPHQWRWGMKFVLARNPRVARQSTAHLLALSNLSRIALTDLMERSPVDFCHSHNGRLIIYRTPGLLEKARALEAYKAGLGETEQRVLDADECVRLEPALAPVRHTIAGAVYTPSEEAGSCEKLTEGLFEQLRGMDGVSVHMSSPVRRLERSGSRIVAAHCDARRIEADHFVIAAGMASRRLLLPLGSSPLLYPIKGYSLSVPDQGPRAPAISVTDYERRTVYVSLGDTLRIVAMVGIGVRGDVLEPDRIALMKQQARELLPAVNLDAAQPWTGERPATPDGMPRIGRSGASDNLWMNIGHGGLGFTLACGSAVLLQHLMGGESPPIDPAPFQPDC